MPRSRRPSSSASEIQIAGAPSSLVLQAGQSYSWAASCTPTSIGIASAFLDFDIFHEGISLETQDVSCEGIAGSLEIAPASLAFPDTFRHPLDPPSRTVSIRNTGAAPLELSTIRVDGAGFSLVGPQAATLVPGASQDVEVRFAPAAAGDATGHLVVGNADDPQIARVALTGRGVGRAVEVGPPAIDLGAVPAGATVRLGDVLAGAIALHNTDAAASFTITSATVAGDPAYRLIGPDRSILAPGERATLDVELVAGAPGRYDATIRAFLDGDPDPHAQISITALVVDAPAGGSGCGCATGAPAHGLAPGAALLLGLRRRRRQRQRQHVPRR